MTMTIAHQNGCYSPNGKDALLLGDTFPPLFFQKHPPPPLRFRPRELLYPANLLTMIRLMLLPITIRHLLKTENAYHHKALVYIGIAMITDVLDGPLARYRNEVSTVGEFLDPITDKLTINGLIVVLSYRYELPWWITGLFITRDVGILLSGLHLTRKYGYVMQAQTAGKITTILLTLAIMLHLLRGPNAGRPVFFAALVAGVLSVLQYSYAFSRVVAHASK